MSKLSSSKFCHSTQCSADAWIVALLWKLPQMPSCSANNANLDKNNFDMFYKIDCCAAINGRIWMNNVSNKSRRKNLCYHALKITFVICFFFFFFSNFENEMPSQIRVFLFFSSNSHCSALVWWCSNCILLTKYKFVCTVWVVC